MKRMCSMCGQTKEEEDFRKPNAKGKKYCYCKDCQRFYMKHYMRIYRERRKNHEERNRRSESLPGDRADLIKQRGRDQGAAVRDQHKDSEGILKKEEQLRLCLAASEAVD